LHEVKGIAEPVAAWAVEGVSDSESRFEPVCTVRLLIIGRDDEIPTGVPPREDRAAHPDVRRPARHQQVNVTEGLARCKRNEIP
jgi:hypothetical protein